MVPQLLLDSPTHLTGNFLFLNLQNPVSITYVLEYMAFHLIRVDLSGTASLKETISFSSHPLITNQGVGLCAHLLSL